MEGNLELIPVKSSAIGAIGFLNGELHVVFRSGKRYVYQGVGPHEFDKLLASESKGQFLNTHIVPKHPAKLA